MGHAEPFSFAPDYAPASGVRAQLAGTPAVVANAAWSAAADVWRQVDPGAMDLRHRSLSETLIDLIDEHCGGLGIEVSSPREHHRRGGHVTLRLTDPKADVEQLGRALLADRVVASTRKPDSLRFAVHPLATSHLELWEAVRRLRKILLAGGGG
jgi:kynureninase